MYLKQAFSGYSYFFFYFFFFFPQPGQKQEALEFLWSVQLWVLYISVSVQWAIPRELLVFLCLVDDGC